MPPDPLTERPTASDLFPANLAEAGVKRVEDVVSLQKQLVTYLQDVNRNFLEHMQSEAAVASEFGGRLAGARSMPDVVAAWQEWTNRRMELLAQDGRQVLEETEKLMEAGARVFANGWTVSKS
jgi:Phasin protein